MKTEDSTLKNGHEWNNTLDISSFVLARGVRGTVIGSGFAVERGSGARAAAEKGDQLHRRATRLEHGCCLGTDHEHAGGESTEDGWFRELRWR